MRSTTPSWKLQLYQGKDLTNFSFLEEKIPTDRGVKTRFFTRITDVTTEGGDDDPIKTIEVSKRPFIFDNTDISEDEGTFTYSIPYQVFNLI